GMRPSPAEHEAGGHSRARATRGAAREVLARPWIADRGKGQIEARATNRELVGREFAKAYDASLGQLGDGRGIAVGYMLDEQLRVGGRGNARGLVDVLMSEGNTVEVTAPAPGLDLGLCRACRGECALPLEANEAMHVLLVPIDAGEAGLGKGDWREAACSDGRPGLSDRWNVGHACTPQARRGLKMMAGSALRGRLPPARTRADIASM